jgi:hypothetical protein
VLVWSYRKINREFCFKHKHKELEFSKSCVEEEMINTVSGVFKHNVKESNIKFELFASSTKENRKIIGRSFVPCLVDDERQLLKCHKTNRSRRFKTRN